MNDVLSAAGLCGAAVGDPETAGWVRIDAGRIGGVGLGAAPSGATDLGDVVLVPGFIDLQVNGFDTTDFAAATTGESAALLGRLAATGVTGCCPTLVTAPLDAYDARLDRLDRLGAADRATLLGVHLEGPFLGGAPGAHPVGLLRTLGPAELEWLRGLLDRYGDLIRVVTLAPEADPGLAGTRLLVSRGVTVALGHSTCSYDEARAAADVGATLVTHVFNGMGPLHHRAPGLAGAALDDPRLTPTLIADLVHVHPAVVGLVARVKRGAALVTDAVAVAAGSVGGLPIHAEDGAARLPDGTLAGSDLTMDAAVRNLVAVGVGLERAVEMASTIPAEVLGLADRGRLAPGMRADVVALDRRTLEVRGVWVAGQSATAAA